MKKYLGLFLCAFVVGSANCTEDTQGDSPSGGDGPSGVTCDSGCTGATGVDGSAWG